MFLRLIIVWLLAIIIAVAIEIIRYKQDPQKFLKRDKSLMELFTWYTQVVVFSNLLVALFSVLSLAIFWIANGHFRMIEKLPL